jgi:hypothetical protein
MRYTSDICHEWVRSASYSASKSYDAIDLPGLQCILDNISSLPSTAVRNSPAIPDSVSHVSASHRKELLQRMSGTDIQSNSHSECVQHLGRIALASLRESRYDT